MKKESTKRYKCVYCISGHYDGFDQLKAFKKHIPICRRAYIDYMEQCDEPVTLHPCQHDARHMVPNPELRIHEDILCDKIEFSTQLNMMLQKYMKDSAKNRQDELEQSTSNNTKETSPHEIKSKNVSQEDEAKKKQMAKDISEWPKRVLEKEQTEAKPVDSVTQTETEPHHEAQSPQGLKHLNKHQDKVMIKVMIKLTADKQSELVDIEGKLIQIETRKSPQGMNLHLTFLTITMLILALITRTSAWPMICTNNHGRTQWKVPEVKECSELIQDDHVSRPQPGTVQLYKRNHLKYTSEAWVCKRMKQTKQLYTYFWNTDHLEKYNIKQIPISEEECLQMKQFRRSTKGDLQLKDGVWKTNNKLKYEMPPAFYACCKWTTFEVENDFLYPTKVWKDHDVKEAMSATGSIAHCEYQSGKCQLSQGTQIIWEPNKTENCQYLPWKTITGNTYGRFFVADQENIAFSLEDLQAGRDFGNTKILIPPQGIPFRVIRSTEPYLRKAYYQDNNPKLPRAKRQASKGRQIKDKLQSLLTQRQLIKDEMQNPKENSNINQLRKKDK
ncbi:MAG: hypothetical protein GY816_00215, partial [Cytophagales bacterium]|nr:hypothetical protein [Cytophagales bacterium]